MKARGDGLALELGRVEFALRGCAAAVRLDGVEQPHWCVLWQGATCLLASLTAVALGVLRCSSWALPSRVVARTGCVELPPRVLGSIDESLCMQVTVARCRPQDVVDSLGGFRATLQAR